MKIDIAKAPAYLRPRLQRIELVERAIKARKNKVLAIINKQNRKKRTRALCLLGGALSKHPDLVRELKKRAPDALQEAFWLCPDLFRGV